MRASLILLLLFCQDPPKTDAEREREARKEAQDAIDAFSKKFKASKDDGDRIAAIGELAKTSHMLVAKKLMSLIGAPLNVDVRVAAAKGVGTCGVRKAAGLLARKLSAFRPVLASESDKLADEQKICEAIVSALGVLDNRIVTPTLLPILKKNNVPLIRACVVAIGKIRDCAAMDELLRLYYAATSPEGQGRSNPRKTLAEPTLETLKSITGENFKAVGEWQDWWKANRRTFENRAKDPE